MDVSFYRTKEYQELSPHYKKCLIGVLEGITQGAQIRCSNKLYIMLVKNGIYLKHYNQTIIQPKTPHDNKQNSFFISYNKALIDRLLIDRNDPDYHIKFAKFLGYPTCCIKTFIRKNSRIQKNICSKHKYMKFIPHVPCHMQCKKSLRIGKQIKKSIERVDPGLIDLL